MSLSPSFLQQRLPLQDLLDLRAFADVCQSFAELYRVGLKVFDEAGNALAGGPAGSADEIAIIARNLSTGEAQTTRADASGAFEIDVVAQESPTGS